MDAPTARPHRLLEAALTAGTVALAGCSTGAQEHDSSASAGHDAAADDADSAFVQGMIPQHEQAIEMARLAEDRAGDPRITDLAARIEAAQGPELDTLGGWLADWGVELAGEGGHDGVQHGEGSMGI